MTSIQFFDSALNLNIHFHMLFLDGVYEVDLGGAIGSFHVIKPPGSKEISLLLGNISESIASVLEQAGYLAGLKCLYPQLFILLDDFWGGD